MYTVCVTAFAHAAADFLAAAREPAQACAISDVDMTVVDRGGRARAPVLAVLLELQRRGHALHFCSLRRLSATAEEQTRRQLTDLGLDVASLHLAPAQALESAAASGAWKALTRDVLAGDKQRLTVGDALSDHLHVELMGLGVDGLVRGAGDDVGLMCGAE